MWTRDVLIDRVRHVANAEQAEGDWPPEVVLDHASLVLQQEWGHLLGANPRLRVRRVVVTVAADGTVPWSALSTTTQRVHRVVTVLDGEVSLLDAVRARSPGSVPWERAGDLLVTDRAGQVLTLLVTHTPPLVRDLTGTSAIDWPDGWEMILAYETAAHLLHKGARESDAAGVLEEKAERLRAQLLAAVGRDSTQPLMMHGIDDATDWGGA